MLASTPATAPRTRAEALAVAAWGLLVVAGALLGRSLYADDPLIRIGNAPLVGSADVRLSMRVVPALLLAAAALMWAPRIAAALRWRALLAASWAAPAGWACALAFTDGIDALAEPLRRRYEYLAAVDRVGGPLDFLDGFTAALASFPTHVKGHPPGLLLALAGLDGIGLGGAVVAAALIIAAGALAAPAALVALRELAGEAPARRAAPFVAFAPAAVWVATSADALFMGVAAAGIALFALATTRRAAGLAVAAGLVLGGALHLSYGIAPLGLVVLAIAYHRRDARSLAFAGAAVAAVFAAFAAAGFWWLDGLQATRGLHDAGVASRRPYLPFLVIAPAAFALAIGPAAFAGLTRLRGSAWVLCGATLAAVAVADLSGLSRGETERIWLPFAPFLLLAAAALRGGRGWLAAQLGLALALQLTVRSPW